MIPKNQKRILICSLAAIILLCGIILVKVLFQNNTTPAPTQPNAEQPLAEPTPTEAPLLEDLDIPAADASPFALHGKLHVSNTELLDQNDQVTQLRGVSSHHLTLYPKFFNEETLKYIRDAWGVNLIRLANYTEFFGNGYCDGGDAAQTDEIIKSTIQIADSLGMYVILDWHTLTDNNPLKYLEGSKEFFRRYTELYKDHDNIIYEICNEPNGDTTWDDIYQYAEQIIPLIRSLDPDAVILVAPAAYTTDLESVAAKPLPYDNVMYTAHFYAGSHREDLRNGVLKALEQNVPIFISECNITDANWQDGKVNTEQGQIWFDLIDSNNLSYTLWSFTDADEVFSFFRPGTTKLSGFTDQELSESGQWNVNHFLQLKSTP